MTWRQQYAVFTPEGFLIASSAAITPRISLSYQDIGEMHIVTSTVKTDNEGTAITILRLRVTYQNKSVQLLTLDHRFGPEERLWKLCIGAHHWYMTRDVVAEETKTGEPPSDLLLY